MTPKKRILLVGTKNGKRAIHWPGLLVTFAAYMVVFTLSRDFVGWCWNAIVREQYRADWGRIIGFGLVMSVGFLGFAIWRARRDPLEYLPALDRGS
jgi:putative Mn2+ efflux pump MntP